MDDSPYESSERNDSWPVVDFLLRYRLDQEAGEDRSIEYYLVLYPGHEAVIAREYTQLVDGDGGRRDTNGCRSSVVRDGLCDRSPGSERIFAGFEIGEELGRGGEGTVYLAYDSLLRRQVALKIVTRPQSDLDEARMLRAAALAARLDHHAIVTVYGAGRYEGVLWAASEFVEGTSLAVEIERRQDLDAPLAEREVASLLAPIARGLQHAHANGVVHRDVKPANLLLGRDRRLVLADFGMARDDNPGNDLTAPGELRGTPGYMAPEQFRHGARGPQVDIYALGVVAYECASLQQPFKGLSQAATLSLADHVDVWTLPAWRGFGPDLRAVLSMAMAKDPMRRYATAQALAEDLEHLAAGHPVKARAPGWWRRAVVWGQRNRSVAVGLGVTTLSLVAALTVTWVFLLREQTLRQSAQDSVARTQRVVRSILYDNRRAVEFDGTPVALRHRMVRQAVESLEELADADRDDLTLQRELCLALIRLGEIHCHSGSPSRRDADAARHCFTRAEILASERLKGDARQGVLVATAKLRRGDLCLTDGNRQQASSLYEAAIRLIDPIDQERRSIRGSAMGMLAEVARDSGDYETARRWIAQAQGEFRVDIKDATSRNCLLAANMTCATIMAQAGDPAAAEQLLRNELQSFATSGPDVIRQASLRVRHDLVLAGCLLMMERVSAALTVYDAGVARCRAMVARDESDHGAAHRLLEVLQLREHAHGAGSDAGRADRAEAVAIAARYGIPMPPSSDQAGPHGFR